MFIALTSGKVSVVSALIGTNPLFSILFGYILLRGDEDFDWGTVLGCVIIVLGAVIITLF
jgi:uncharacterized membrane protein